MVSCARISTLLGTGLLVLPIFDAAVSVAADKRPKVASGGMGRPKVTQR